MDVYIEIETDIFWIKTIEREKEMSSATLAVIWKCNFIEWLDINRERERSSLISNWRIKRKVKNRRENINKF